MVLVAIITISNKTLTSQHLLWLGAPMAALLILLGVGLMLAAFRLDVPMLRGGDPDTWNGWLHGTASRSC